MLLAPSKRLRTIVRRSLPIMGSEEWLLLQLCSSLYSSATAWVAER